MSTSGIDLPPGIAALVDALAAARGVRAVVLGGSRALGADDPASDWDIGLYYRGDLDCGPLAAFGTVHPPGTWGRVMNGGAWLSIDGMKVDVLLRDLDFVDRCAARARDGDYDVDLLLGYVAGVPTYSLMAELATCAVLRGAIQHPGAFPEKLAAAAPPRWRYQRDFTLEYARMLARRGAFVPAIGQVAKAILEEAHARVCAARRWTHNERRLVDQSGLDWASAWIVRPPQEPQAFLEWIDEAARHLGS